MEERNVSGEEKQGGEQDEGETGVFPGKGVRRKSRARWTAGKWASSSSSFFFYLVVFLAGELRAEVFPWGSLNSLALPSLVLDSPRGLQLPLPVTQPPDSTP